MIAPALLLASVWFLNKSAHAEEAPAVKVGAHWPATLKVLWPSGMRLAVLYAPAHADVADALIATFPDNIKPIRIEASTPIGRQFYRLTDAQALLVIPDDQVITDDLAVSVVITAYRRHIPVLATRTDWAGAGAVVACPYSTTAGARINDAVLKFFALPDPAAVLDISR